MDPIADMLAAIKNAQASKIPIITIPASKVKVAILEILKREGYISGYTVSDDPKSVVSAHWVPQPTTNASSKRRCFHESQIQIGWSSTRECHKRRSDQMAEA